MKYFYSDRALSVLRQARTEAERRRHDRVGTEHILLALLLQDGGPAAAVLAELGIKPNDLISRVVEMAGPGNSIRPRGVGEYTTRAKKVMEYTLAAARNLGKQTGLQAKVTIDTDHILLALIQEREGVAATALASFGATAEAVAGISARIRDKDKPPDASPGDSAPQRPLRASEALAASDIRESTWFLEIDQRSATPIYEQIIARIEEAVATGALPVGERLAAVREMAAELGIAPGTVARAYGALEQRGILETDRARGTRVAERTQGASSDESGLLPMLAELLRPAAVSAFHMGAKAKDVQAALRLAMRDIFQ